MMEITIKINRHMVSVEVSDEEPSATTRADERSRIFPMKSGGIGMNGNLTNT